MTILSVAVIWLVVGFVAAMVFGRVIQRTNHLSDEDEMPRRAGAHIQYLRRGKIGTASTAPVKRHSAKRHATG